LAERHRLLVDQLPDGHPQLGVRGLQVEAAEVGEIDPVDQLAMDAELQVLIGAVDRRPVAGRSLNGRLSVGRCALAGEPETVAQFPVLARPPRPKSRRSRGPATCLAGVGTPVSLAASSLNEAVSALVLPFSGVPSLIALLTVAVSRGITCRGSRPMARTASARGTGP